MSEIKKEMVNHPDHYQGKRFEVIDIIEDYNLGFNLGNAVKYILRCEKKHAKTQDLKKAIWYIEREIKNTNEKREKDIVTEPVDIKNTEIKKVMYDTCPVCGCNKESEKQVCDKCAGEIKWGASISDYCLLNGGVWHRYYEQDYYVPKGYVAEYPPKENVDYQVHLMVKSYNHYYNSEYIIFKNDIRKFVNNKFYVKSNETVISWRDNVEKCESCGKPFVVKGDDLICEECHNKYVGENENEYKCVDNRNKYPSFYAEDYCVGE